MTLKNFPVWLNAVKLGINPLFINSKRWFRWTPSQPNKITFVSFPMYPGFPKTNSVFVPLVELVEICPFMAGQKIVVTRSKKKNKLKFLNFKELNHFFIIPPIIRYLLFLQNDASRVLFEEKAEFSRYLISWRNIKLQSLFRNSQKLRSNLKLDLHRLIF